MKKRIRIPLILMLFLVLVAIRAYGTKLFYDPFIQYFQNDYLSQPIPEFNTAKLFLNAFFRYWLNVLISLVIIYLAFQKRTLVIFSVKFYVAAFFVLSLAYYFLLKTGFENGYLLGFYVRRLIIHPVFLLVLLPAFYYQQRLINNANHHQ